MPRCGTVLLLALLAACGGEPPPKPAPAIPGAWEVRWPAVFRDLRVARPDDTAWLDRIRRAQAEEHADLDLVLSPDGAATLTYRNTPPIPWSGRWVRVGDEVRLDLRNPSALKPVQVLYRWNGRALWFPLQVDAANPADDTLPIVLTRASPAAN
jgi:hypothetical protein